MGVETEIEETPYTGENGKSQADSYCCCWRSCSGRANSPRCRPREPVRFMGAGVAFVRAQSHSVRVNPSLPATSNCQQSLVSRESSFPNSTPLLQDAKKYLLTLGRIGGSPSSTNVMCLDVRGRDRWDWVGTKFRRVSIFPQQGGGGN